MDDQQLVKVNKFFEIFRSLCIMKWKSVNPIKKLCELFYPWEGWTNLDDKEQTIENIWYYGGGRKVTYFYGLNKFVIHTKKSTLQNDQMPVKLTIWYLDFDPTSFLSNRQEKLSRKKRTQRPLKNDSKNCQIDKKSCQHVVGSINFCFCKFRYTLKNRLCKMTK